MNRSLLALSLAFSLAGPALAVNPGEMLKDSAQEHRARELGKELRCLVCQNQSIDDSDAELARDLRVIVRERITAGDSDDQVRGYLVDRYGDFVLLKPPLKGATYVLWFGPVALLAAGAAGAAFFYRRRRAAPDSAAAPLSGEERRRLKALLGDDKLK